MTISLPANQLRNEPLVPALERKAQDPARVQDMALTASMFTTWNAEDFAVSVSSGDTSAVRAVRQEVSSQATSAEAIVQETANQGLPPQVAANRLEDFFNKQNEWLSTSDGLFLEQVLALNDPTVNNETARFATNLQLAQEQFLNRINSEETDTGWFGTATDFVDRYVLRAVVIGGWEQMFNRNEVKGLELLNAAASMSPDEYSVFIDNYINELDSEGFFKSDNIFALQDGLLELENRGENPNEFIDRFFGLVDVAPVIGAAAKGATLLRSGTALSRVAAVSGPNVATDLGENALRNAPNNPHPQIVADMGPTALSPNASELVRPSISRSAQISDENTVVRGLRDLNRDSFLGVGRNGELVQEASRRIVNLVRESTNNPLVNVGNPVRMSDTGMYSVDLTLGTVKSGSPFKTEAAAQRAASKLTDEFPTATTRQVDPNDSSKGFYVSVEEYLDLGKEAPELSTQSMLNPMQKLGRLLYSKAAYEDTTQNTLATLAEGGVSSIGRLVRPQVKLLTRANTADKDTLSKIMSDLRDGPESFIRNGYSREEFADKWRVLRGSEPTDKNFEQFQALRDVNDASWMMRTHQRLQKYVSRGYYALVDHNGARIAGTRFEGALDKGELVINLSTGSYLRLGDLPKNVKVWKLDREIDGMQYAVRPSEVKALSPDDVLGYNSGGRRVNPNANTFVTAGVDKPRAFLAAFTEKQAQEVVDFFKEVKRLVAEGGDVDDYIRKTNDWNPEVQSLDDLEKFAQTKGFRLDEDINFKSRDGEIRTGEVADEFSETWGEYVTFGMHRADDVLTEYGGKEALQHDPITAIFDDFSSITHQYTSNVIVQQGIEGWLKAARRSGSGWNVDNTILDSRKAFMEATQKETNNSTASELLTQRDVLLNRMRVKGDWQRRAETLGKEVQSFVFDKSGLRIAEDLGVGKAQNALLNLGFQSAFGFLNFAQIVVQGFHAPVIAAVAPKQGLKGLAMMPAVRLALMTDDVASESLAIKRLAKASNMSDEDAYELVRFIQVSGRDIINESALENGTATQWGVSGWKGESALPSAFREARSVTTRAVSSGLDAATVFFKEGDRIARLTAINTAFLEFKAANPSVSALSEYGMRTIRRREEALTLRMTNVNRATAQEGLMKLPTQWMSHSLRVLENVVVGRDLSVAERSRLIGMYTVFFGLTGMGFGKATDYIGEKIGAEEAGNVHTALKYGILDGLLNMADVDLALARRMAPITMFSDTYKNIVQGNQTPLETALGPSGSITGGFTENIMSAVGHMLSGEPIMMTEDTVRIARQFTGIDNVAKAWGIYQNGIYRSRTGSQLPFELNAADAIGQLLGFTPAEVSEWYEENQWSYSSDRKRYDFQDSLLADWQTAVDILNEGDNDERGYSLLREIETKIALSNFSEYDKGLIRQSLREQGQEDIYRLIIDRQRREQGYRANVLDRSFRGGDE